MKNFKTNNITQDMLAKHKGNKFTTATEKKIAIAFYFFLAFNLAVQIMLWSFVAWEYIIDWETKISPWFNVFHFFTNQTNMLATVLIILLIFDVKYKFLKSNSWTIICAGYIFIVGLAFFAILLPTDSFMFAYTYYIPWAISTTFAHAVTPISFVILTILSSYHKRTNKIWKLGKQMTIGLAYPLMYFVYLSMISFCLLNPYWIKEQGVWVERTYISVYGAFTNLNPKFILDGVPGNPLNAFLFLGFFALFGLFVYIFWIIDFKLKMPSQTKVERYSQII